MVSALVVLAICVLHLGALAPMASAEEKPIWNVAWITDTQTPACEWITTLVGKVQANKPSILLHTGDARFEWANQCAWKDVVTLMRSQSPPVEFHLAPGNHDIDHALKPHLRRAASQGIYLIDTGQMAEGKGYYHKRVTANASGDEWPAWNPEVVGLDAWQPKADKMSYRYVFKRGGIRFIVCDCYYSDEQRDWVRELITQPDDSSVSILLQHEHTLDRVASYFAGLEGRHNVKLMLTGHDHNFHKEERHGVTFITGAGIAMGHHRDADAMTLWVYRDRLRMDRYLIPKGASKPAVQGPETIWECDGKFSQYQRPASPAVVSATGLESQTSELLTGRTLGPNLVYNGGFDNGVWYKRFRGWSPAGWYQWFTCGDDAPEHTVGKDVRHSGKEYVRIHMWAHAWRGGILQNVRGIDPCHWYRMTAYGWFAKTAEDPQPHSRIGLDPYGGLREQYAVDVTKHPAPPYNECVGDDPKTEKVDWPDIPETTVWSPYHDYFNIWGKFEVSAEAKSDVITAILYCNPKQRPGDKPIYEMNWDTVSIREVPWPTKRLVSDGEMLPVDKDIKAPIVTIQPEFDTAQVTWRTKMPAGAAQVLYRFFDSGDVTNQPRHEKEPTQVRTDGFPFHSPVVYERSITSHHIEIQNLSIPESAVEMQLVALSRALIDGEGKTLCSPLVRTKIR
jgi:hypothetical protein